MFTKLLVIFFIAVLLQDDLNDASNSEYCQWYSIDLDIIESKIFKSPIFKATRKGPTNNFKILFLNKGVELINVPHIFHDPSLKACIHVTIKFDDPTVVYLLNNPVRS